MKGYGLIHVYTGTGKGKTTAALGLALRAVGRGAKVAIIQFMKGSAYSGEQYTLNRFNQQVDHYKFGWTCHHSALIKSGMMKCQKCGRCFKENRNPENDYCSRALTTAKELLASGEYQLMVLDEIGNALRRQLLAEQEVVDLLGQRHPDTELVLTGRDMPERIKEQAHYVTDFAAVKHPFEQGVDSRRGIEY